MKSERPSLQAIELRHDRDRWRDGLFIASAVVMIVLSLAAYSSKAAGTASPRHWNETLTVTETTPEIVAR